MSLEKGTQKLAQALLEKVYTTATLKQVTETLEDLAQNQGFKSHANSIVSDPTLTEAQKKTQLTYLLRTIELPIVYDFFIQEAADGQFWLFSSDKIDYFDKFVQTFSLETENVGVVFMTTATKLSSSRLKEIVKDLSDAFGYRMIINHEVNPTIIGGVQIRIENMVFDYSLRSKFSQFQRQWLASLEKTEKAIGHPPA